VLTGGPSRRRIALGGLAALIVAAVVITVFVRGAGRSSARATLASTRISTASISVIHSRMVASLRRDKLSWHWVVCLRNGHRFKGVPIVRCNVDFGDPHVEAYCVVLRGGRLLTNFEDRAIPCGPDNAGDTQTIVAYN
jgi:hypothetical protein